MVEALREGRVLTAKEQAIHEGELVAVLKSPHDELDACVSAAYGWADLQLPRDEQTLINRNCETYWPRWWRWDARSRWTTRNLARLEHTLRRCF